MLILVSAAARAEEPKAATPDAPAAKMVEATPAAAAPTEAAGTDAKAPAAVAKGAEGRPYVDTAITFLKALIHSARSGEEGELAWAAARANAADAVTLKVGGKDLALDLAGKKSDAQLVRFHKLSTLREGAAVKGVTLENLELRVGAEAHTGKATVRMDEKDGKWVVTALEVE
ncbi:MAG TPA: hypothetical protein VFL36_02470 [Myxococcales bacterium]|nr:hypothetical protein [Myxococcales bacterium]